MKELKTCRAQEERGFPRKHSANYTGCGHRRKGRSNWERRLLATAAPNGEQRSLDFPRGTRSYFSVAERDQVKTDVKNACV